MTSSHSAAAFPPGSDLPEPTVIGWRHAGHDGHGLARLRTRLRAGAGVLCGGSGRVGFPGVVTCAGGGNYDEGGDDGEDSSGSQHRISFRSGIRYPTGGGKGSKGVSG
jgi:hypothetical protein